MNDMKIETNLSLQEFLTLIKEQDVPHYWHDHLPADFIQRAERMYERLKGIDDWVDKTSKDQWVDFFRAERSPESALTVYSQCLAAVTKMQRKCRGFGQMDRKGVYYLALTRSACQDSEEAFRVTETYHGAKFDESVKQSTMRIIDSCVRYRPIVIQQQVVPAITVQFNADQYGMGKSRNPFFGRGSTNN